MTRKLRSLHPRTSLFNTSTTHSIVEETHVLTSSSFPVPPPFSNPLTPPSPSPSTPPRPSPSPSSPLPMYLTQSSWTVDASPLLSRQLHTLSLHTAGSTLSPPPFSPPRPRPSPSRRLLRLVASSLPPDPKLVLPHPPPSCHCPKRCLGPARRCAWCVGPPGRTARAARDVLRSRFQAASLAAGALLPGHPRRPSERGGALQRAAAAEAQLVLHAGTGRAATQP